MKEVCQKVEESREALKSLLQRMERLENDCIARVLSIQLSLGSQVPIFLVMRFISRDAQRTGKVDN